MASTERPRAIAWDPKSPATLQLPTTDPETGELRVDQFFADDGVGCNSYERSALLKLVAAQYEYYTQPAPGDKSVKSLSLSYRRALLECLEGWEEDESMNNALSLHNLELLKIMYATTQLSDVYLLMPSSDDTIDNEDPWSVPGAVTADTVRYLRSINMSDPFDFVDEGLQDMLELSQPEQYDSAYWKLVRTLVLRGCLNDAWMVLSRHSLCRRAAEETQPLDDYHATLAEQDKEGFLVLRGLLLSAPIPGGRSDWQDSGLAPDDNVQEGEDNAPLMDGVRRDAYKLWDSSVYASGEDGPLEFNPHAANATLKTWRRAVVDNATLSGLVHRIPQLQSNVIEILMGEFDVADFESWSEALCAELLYQRPTLCPKDMHFRVEKIMKKLDAPVDSGFNKIVLSVMGGDAGCALQTLYEYGGSSGAALPATMTSLLCNLLTDAQQIPQPDPSSFSFQTEFLLSASEALLSSFSSCEPDLGVSLSTKLLLPHAKPSGDVRITATLGVSLAHHGPSTDAEARVLLDLCSDLVARKCERVIDGCVNLILFRYWSYKSEQRYGGAMHWLLKGIELEAAFFATTDGRREEGAWGTVNASGVFGTILCGSCLDVAKALLADLAGQDSLDNAGYDFARATEMDESIQRDDPSGLALDIPEVKLLNHIVGMARDIVDGKGDKAKAKHIIDCLRENVNEDDGVVAPLAHYAMYGDLLLLAYSILQRDEDSEERSIDEQKPVSFDVEGIRILMTKLTEFITLAKRNGKKTAAFDTASMRLALGKGLKRAIMAENAKRKACGLLTPHDHLASARSTKLSTYSLSDQEKIVQYMLGP